MTRRRTLAGLLFGTMLAAALWSNVNEASASQVARSTAAGLSRQQIRSMPILERPYRFGHFYGNTVRRLNSMSNRGR